MHIRDKIFLVVPIMLSCWLGACHSSTATTPPVTGSGAPTISAQPGNQIVNAGQTATFSVSASGADPLSYQWKKNGSVISGVTTATYTTPATVGADADSIFSVVVSNSLGSATSNAATLVVNPVPSTDVTSFKNDFARDGQNLTESFLTTANVSSTTFGLIHNLSVTGKVDAQPLYLAQFKIGGSAHNVVFVATEHNMVYAFDADSGAMLWSVSLTLSGETTSDSRGCGQVSPEIGITATPVIDKKAGENGAIYVVAMTKDGSGTYHQRLHALDLTSGAELFSGPKEVQATYPTATGTTTFVPGDYKERPGLLLLNGIIYTSWSSHCDITPYEPWFIGYNQTTLAQTSVLNLAPNANGNGPSIWMAGSAPAVDSSGNIYLLAANGVFDTTLNANNFPNLNDYGNAFVKISVTGTTLAVSDYFEMSIEAADNSNDRDLGSGGALLLPDLTDGGGTVRHLAVGAGKDGNLYVVNRDNLGKFSMAANNIWQEMDGIFTDGGVFSTPSYFNNALYIGDAGGTVKMYSIAAAKLSNSPVSQSNIVFAYPGVSPAVSANGGSNGIIWAAENVSPAVLHAYDATNLGKELYNSSQAGARDQCGSGNKFIVPTVADGKVFLGTQNSVCVFGFIH